MSTIKTNTESLFKKCVLALSPADRMLRTRLTNGAVVLGRNRAGYGGRGVYLQGDDIEPELRHLGKFLTADSVFIDVGANTGVYSLKAAGYLTGGEVIAVEPNLEMLGTLAMSVRENGYRNVRLRNLCASDTLGHADFWLNEGKPNSFSLVRHDQNADRMSVITVPLDDLVEWEGLTRVDYIKLDVEGSEDAVLRGAVRTIAKFRPIVQYEVTIQRVSVELPGYEIFRAEDSPNRVCIPRESGYGEVARELGWLTV